MRKTMRTTLTPEEWNNFVKSTKAWAYENCRSDLSTDHPRGVRALDEPFNELCAHVETGWEAEYAADEGGLETRITELINKVSREGLSHTPDYLLARYLMACLQTFEVVTLERDAWHRLEDE